MTHKVTKKMNLNLFVRQKLKNLGKSLKKPNLYFSTILKPFQGIVLSIVLYTSGGNVSDSFSPISKEKSSIYKVTEVGGSTYYICRIDYEGNRLVKITEVAYVKVSKENK